MSGRIYYPEQNVGTPVLYTTTLPNGAVVVTLRPLSQQEAKEIDDLLPFDPYLLIMCNQMQQEEGA